MSLFTASALTFRHLQYFLAVASAHSFTGAARLCNVTQSTLSSGIRDLEAELGCELFDRSRRHIVLTAFGEKILPEVREVVEKAEQITSLSRSSDGGPIRPLRVGIIPTIAPYLLPEIAPEIERHFPEIEFVFHENVSEVLIRNIKEGVLDTAILAFPYDIKNLSSQKLFSEGFYLLRSGKGPSGVIRSDAKKGLPDSLAHDQPFARGEEAGYITGSEIDPESLLLLEEGHCLREHALSLCAARPSGTERRFQGTSLASLIQMVRLGYGTTLLPEMAVTGLSAAKAGAGGEERQEAPKEELQSPVPPLGWKPSLPSSCPVYNYSGLELIAVSQNSLETQSENRLQNARSKDSPKDEQGNIQQRNIQGDMQRHIGMVWRAGSVIEEKIGHVAAAIRRLHKEAKS